MPREFLKENIEERSKVYLKERLKGNINELAKGYLKELFPKQNQEKNQQDIERKTERKMSWEI